MILLVSILVVCAAILCNILKYSKSPPKSFRNSYTNSVYLKKAKLFTIYIISKHVSWNTPPFQLMRYQGTGLGICMFLNIELEGHFDIFKFLFHFVSIFCLIMKFLHMCLEGLLFIEFLFTFLALNSFCHIFT